MKRSPTVSIAALALLASACGGAPAPVPAPPSPAAQTPPAPPAVAPPASAAKEPPPASLAAKAAPFPAVSRVTLANGVRLSIVESHALPVIQARVLVHAGKGFAAPGVGEITGDMLKEGGTRSMTSPQLASRVESLGSQLAVSEGPDSTTLSMGVMRGQLDDALSILAEVVQAPRFDATELGKLKTRMTDEAQDAARSSGAWAISRVLYKTLYPASSPYATSGLVPSEIAKVDGAAIRAFHGRFYRPKNVELVLAGDLDAEAARKSVEKAFGAWKGATGPDTGKVEFPDPAPLGATRVIVSNRPKSIQSDCVVTELLPDRHAPNWATVRVALQVFGGNMTGRLFQDVREKRSLAYRADATAFEVAHGALPLYAYAGTQAPKTVDAVQGLLDDLVTMKTSPATDEEVATARRYLSDIFAIRMETVGTIADLVVRLRELDLPDDYWDNYRAALRTVATADADDVGAKIFSADHALILVAGDADVIAQPLARFGEVTVVDPEHDFAITKTIPKAAPNSGAQ